MKNIFKILIFLFFQSLTINLFADVSNDCAVNNDKVKEYSYEICQEDESFRVLYEMFPRLFDEGLFAFGDFGEIEELKSNPEVALDNQYKKFSNLFYEIFKSMSTLVTYLIMFFVFYNVFFTILKTTEEGGFIDYNRESLLKTVGYSGVTIFLLLPVGNLITAQIILLALAVLGISLANYIYGYYLASLQTNIEYVASEEDKESRFLIDDYSNTGAATASKSYVSQLTKIALCRETTSQYIMTQESFSTNTSNLEERRFCSAGEETFNKINDYIKESNEPEYPSFFNVSYDDVKQLTGGTLAQNKNIKFGIMENRNCPTDLIRSYSCGEITTHVPKIGDNYLINIYGFEKFINKMISVSNSLSLTGNNQSIIENGWESIKNDILNEINVQAKKDKNNISDGELTKIKIAEEIYYKRDLMQLKRVSYIYHQLMLNSLTSGLSLHTYENDGYWDSILNLFSENFEKNHENFNAFQRDWSKVNSLAKKIQKNHCQLNSNNLNNSHTFVDRLNKGSFFGSGTSARCVDFDLMQVYGVDFEGRPIEKLEGMKKSAELIKEITEEFEEISQEIFNRRVAVEMSFINSLKEMQDENLLNDIRKRGWLTMPRYIMEFSKDIKVNNTYIKALIGSNGFKPLAMERNMVSYEIMGDPEIFNNSFIPYTGLSNVFKSFIDQKEENSVYNNNATFTQSLIESDKEKFLRGDQNLTEYIFTTLNPIEPLKETLGLDMVENLTDVDENLALIEECQKDIDKCPIPKKDPIVELNRYGHYLINNSLQYFAILVSLKGLASFGKGVKNYNENLENKKSLQETFTGGVVEGKNGSKKGKKSFMSASLSYLGDALDIISDILSGIGFLVVMLFFVGVFLAYILPLIPLLYFVIGFLGWLLMVIQTLMIVPVWAVYFIKYKDYKDIINSAAKTYGLQIVLKPSFMVIGLMFSWELIKVALFFVNVTIFPLLNAMSSDTTLLSFTQNVVFLMIFVFIIGIMISFVLNVMQNLSDQLLTILDVQPSGDSNQGFSSIMQYYILNAGMDARDSIAEGIENGIEKAGLKVSKLAKDAKSSSEDYDLLYNKEKNFLNILKDFAEEKDPNLMTDSNLSRTMENDVENYGIQKEVADKIGFENNELEKMKQDYEESKNHKKDIVDRVKEEVIYTDGKGNQISTEDMTRTEEDLKEELKSALSKEIDKTINFGDQEIDIKINMGGSENSEELFNVEYRNGETINTVFSDGKGNDIIIEGECNLQKEDLKEILKEQIEEEANNDK